MIRIHCKRLMEYNGAIDTHLLTLWFIEWSLPQSKLKTKTKILLLLITVRTISCVLTFKINDEKHFFFLLGLTKLTLNYLDKMYQGLFPQGLYPTSDWNTPIPPPLPQCQTEIALLYPYWHYINTMSAIHVKFVSILSQEWKIT